mmetsp:Transcript_30050/g.41882  ORF Transcript_30050/g.41882 Transcript_30050/m.41882 type:complete len:200 (+) Transcript_30050:820-1419(+)
MLGTLVCRWPFVLITLPSISTPTLSSPSPSRYGTRPMATNTLSASMTSSSPPLEGWTLSCTLSPTTSAPITLVPSLKFMSFCLRDSTVWNIFATSESTPGVMRSRNSTTVTSEPRRPQTDPISRPMTPAPMTISFSGTLSNSRAPVEETIIFSSISIPGILATSDPVARMTFLALIVSVPPSFKSMAISLALLSFPKPL